MNKLFLATLLFTLTMLTIGCYRMPREDEYSLVPITNNPSVTREKAQGPIPQLSY